MAEVSGIRKMNWFPKQSAWDAMETQRLKRKEMAAEFQSQAQQLAAGFTAVTSMQIQGAAETATRSVQSQLETRSKELTKQLEERMAGFSTIA